MLMRISFLIIPSFTQYYFDYLVPSKDNRFRDGQHQPWLPLSSSPMQIHQSILNFVDAEAHSSSSSSPQFVLFLFSSTQASQLFLSSTKWKLKHVSNMVKYQEGSISVYLLWLLQQLQFFFLLCADIAFAVVGFTLNYHWTFS